jgi:hypothetical protein
MIVPLAAAVGLGWILTTLYMHDWYLIFLAPLVAGLILSGVLYASVALAQCRNRWLAGGIGALCGVVLYLAYYHFCFVSILPPGFGLRVDRLPRYIWFRLHTDVTIEVGRPDKPAGPPGAPKPKEPVFFLNVFQFSFELLAIVGLVSVTAWRRARHAFCPELQQWMKREQALMPPQFTARLVEALETGRLAEFVAQTPAGGDRNTSAQLVLEYVDQPSNGALEFPIYLSAVDFPSPEYPGLFRRMRRTTLDKVDLATMEVLYLRPLFPHLAQLLEMQHEKLRDVPRNVIVVPEVERATEEIASITPIPEPHRKRVRGAGYAFSVNIRGLIPVVYIFGGIGFVAAGAWMIDKGETLTGALLAGAGAPALAWGVFAAVWCMGAYENRWILWRLLQEIRQRPDARVNADDPDALYVSIMPRESFSAIKWTMASDVLLLKIDLPKRQILMEGDSDRYRIPARAIAACEPQCFFHPLDGQQQNQLWMARLMVRVEQGLIELLISCGSKKFGLRTNRTRRAGAEDLCRRVRELMNDSEFVAN